MGQEAVVVAMVSAEIGDTRAYNPMEHFVFFSTFWSFFEGAFYSFITRMRPS